jgi:hypothetical protein
VPLLAQSLYSHGYRRCHIPRPQWLRGGRRMREGSVHLPEIHLYHVCFCQEIPSRRVDRSVSTRGGVDGGAPSGGDGFVRSIEELRNGNLARGLPPATDPAS